MPPRSTQAGGIKSYLWGMMEMAGHNVEKSKLEKKQRERQSLSRSLDW